MASAGDPQVAAWFPNLRSEDYEITSPTDSAYNCVAWAAGKTNAWWQALSAPGYYWPDDLPFDDRVETLVRLFQSLGYAPCENEQPEPGYEKVAVYGKNGTYEHTARQLPSGEWISKLGCYMDIRHKTLQGLEGNEYGTVVGILRRPIR